MVPFFLLVYHNLTLKLRLIASQRSNRHHLKMRCPNGGPFWAWIWTRISSIFFFCQLAGTMKITIYMVIFRSKEKFNAISGACTWPQIRNGIANFGALVCELEVRCLHLTVNSQWNHLIFTPKRSFGCENHNISPKCCVLSDFHLLRRWILVCKSHLHGICLNKKKCVHVYTCTIATQGVSPEL